MISPMLPLVARPVATSLDELLAGVTRREPFLTSDSKSGSLFERVWIGGEAHILKTVHVDRDWTMRFNGDVGCLPLTVWSLGLMDVCPESIEHGVVGVAGGLGRNGWGAAILIRDMSDDLVPPGDDVLPDEHVRDHLDHLAALSARTLGWRDDDQLLLPLANRWGWFNPATLAVEAGRGWPDPVPPIAADGWERFAARAPRDLFIAIDALRRDNGPLVAAVRATPQCFVHGDWKLGNVGRSADGRTILIDWSYPGEAPPCHELAWYLALNRSRMPFSKEEAIAAFRCSLDRSGAGPDEWFEQQLAICLLAELTIMGWEKALGDDAELSWWCDRAGEGLRWL